MRIVWSVTPGSAARISATRNHSAEVQDVGLSADLT
jgi:hypothetical protein